MAVSPSAAVVETTPRVVQASFFGGLTAVVVSAMLVEGLGVVAVRRTRCCGGGGGVVIGVVGAEEGVLPAGLKGTLPCLGSAHNLHGFRASVGEGADDLSQLDVSNDLPGVALGNIVLGDEAIVLGDLGTSLEELFMGGLFDLSFEGGSDGEGSDEFHKNK